MTKTTKHTERDAALSEIAKRVLKLETLETRETDSLDFHELAVWKIKQALEEAYRAGQKAGRSQYFRHDHSVIDECNEMES